VAAAEEAAVVVEEVVAAAEEAAVVVTNIESLSRHLQELPQPILKPAALHRDQLSECHSVRCLYQKSLGF